jgi:hypothetical protein
MIKSIRNEITGYIDGLSEKQLRQVVRYIREMLSVQSHKTNFINIQKKGTFVEGYIGGVSHGSLAADIDKEIYG